MILYISGLSPLDRKLILSPIGDDSMVVLPLTDYAGEPKAGELVTATSSIGAFNESPNTYFGDSDAASEAGGRHPEGIEDGIDESDVASEAGTTFGEAEGGTTRAR